MNTTPECRTTHAAGADLISVEDVCIPVGGSVVVSTGYIYDVPMASLVKGRSGLAFNHNIVAFEGLIDPDFIGNEVKVKLFNFSDQPFVINEGDRIAQLVVIDTYTHRYYESTIEARTSGFGSTGGI